MLIFWVVSKFHKIKKKTDWITVYNSLDEQWQVLLQTIFLKSRPSVFTTIIYLYLRHTVSESYVI